jgi:hypothetical protein
MDTETRHSKFGLAVATYSFRGKPVSDLGYLIPSTTGKVPGAQVIIAPVGQAKTMSQLLKEESFPTRNNKGSSNIVID